jgi:hypothetical protein
MGTLGGSAEFLVCGDKALHSELRRIYFPAQNLLVLPIYQLKKESYRLCRLLEGVMLGDAKTRLAILCSLVFG